MSVDVRSDGESVVFALRVQPRAKRNAIVGVHDGALKLEVTAPPVDGAANDAIVKLLSKALDVAKRDVEIVRGHASRDKTVRVTGIDPDDVHALT